MLYLCILLLNFSHYFSMETAILAQSANGAAMPSHPSLQQWLKANPRHSINDYYREFGAQATHSTGAPYDVAVAAPVALETPYSYHIDYHTKINNTVLLAPKKSIVVALALTFLFGPLGLFYASVWGALLMILVDVVAFVLLMTSAVSLTALGGSFAAIGLVGGLIWLVLVQWPACMVWALVACLRYNGKINRIAFNNSL